MHLFAVLVVAILLAGCAGVPQRDSSTSGSPESASVRPASDPSSPSPSAAPEIEVDVDRVLSTVSCGGTPFPIDVLAQTGQAQDADDPAAAALRNLFMSPEADRFLPRSGWVVAARHASHVLFVVEAPTGSESPFIHASVELEDGSWSGAGFGQCWPRVDVGPDLGLAEFFVDPAVALSPDMTEIPVLVTELACTGATSSEGRVVEPAVIESQTSVTVVFAVVPLEGEMFTCPGNPTTPYLLRLPSRLGDRALLDGATAPARDATTCARGETCP